MLLLTTPCYAMLCYAILLPQRDARKIPFMLSSNPAAPLLFLKSMPPTILTGDFGKEWSGKCFLCVVYSTLMRRLSGTLALGIRMLRIPLLKLALTWSWSTRDGKLKLRENSPTPRSEIQYLDEGFSSSVFSGAAGAGAGVTAASEDSVVAAAAATAEALAGSSSSTVAW